MSAPRILLVLDTFSAWSRGALRGLTSVANEQGWTLLHYHSNAELNWLLSVWPPSATVIGPAPAPPWPHALKRSPLVSLNADRSAAGVASVCLNEEAIADAAFEHLSARGFRHFATFRFDDASFARRRDLHFRWRVEQAGLNLAPCWWVDGAEPPSGQEHPERVAQWLRALPKPCALFTCCDSWSRVISRYARVAELSVPEDIAILGADDDRVECEITAPALSSVAVPWLSMGEQAAQLVKRALGGTPIEGARVVIEPTRVICRRSSDTLAIDDPLVAAAVTWIRENASTGITVPRVARAAHTTRQRLERRFRAVLGRTVMQEVRRAHVELAKVLLSTTELPLVDIATRSGFSTAALLNVAFRREVGVPPGAFRRHTRGLAVSDD